MNDHELWAAIDRQRLRTADLLATLTPARLYPPTGSSTGSGPWSAGGATMSASLPASP